MSTDEELRDLERQAAEDPAAVAALLRCATRMGLDPRRYDPEYRVHAFEAGNRGRIHVVGLKRFDQDFDRPLRREPEPMDPASVAKRAAVHAQKPTAALVHIRRGPRDLVSASFMAAAGKLGRGARPESDVMCGGVSGDGSGLRAAAMISGVTCIACLTVRRSPETQARARSLREAARRARGSYVAALGLTCWAPLRPETPTLLVNPFSLPAGRRCVGCFNRARAWIARHGILSLLRAQNHAMPATQLRVVVPVVHVEPLRRHKMKAGGRLHMARCGLCWERPSMGPNTCPVASGPGR